MGRLKETAPKDRERGYILLDVMIGLCIIAIGFGVFLGSLSISGSITSRQGAALAGLIEERSTHARERAVVFQSE
jgi:hypothetical protein